MSVDVTSVCSRSSRVPASSRIARLVSSRLCLITPWRMISARRQRSASSSFFSVSGAVSTRPICSICCASAPDSGVRSPMFFSRSASKPARRRLITRSERSLPPVVARIAAVGAWTRCRSWPLGTVCPSVGAGTVRSTPICDAPRMSVPRNWLTLAPVSAFGPFHESIRRLRRDTSDSTGSARGISARLRPSRLRVIVMPL